MILKEEFFSGFDKVKPKILEQWIQFFCLKLIRKQKVLERVKSNDLNENMKK